jgi:hypothetical protein
LGRREAAKFSVRALLLELGLCGGGQRQRPGQKKQNPRGKEQGTKKGTNQKATSQRERHRSKTTTYLFFFPTYLPTYLPTNQTQKKRNCTRNGYNNRVRHLPFFHLFPFFQF